MLIVIAALSSVILRASTSVIDRNSFGLKRQPIVFLNFVNNFVPGILLSLVLLFFEPALLKRALLDPKLMILGASVQLVAFAFSYGVKHLTVAKVNLANRIGDIGVPLALFLAGATVTRQDFIFSFLISVSVLFLSWHSDKKQNLKILLLPGALITMAIILQSLVGEFVYSKDNYAGIYNSTFACASALIWRSLFCIPIFMWQQVKNGKRSSDNFLRTKADRHQMYLRVLFTLGSQISYNYVLASGNRLVAWPILNAVSIFAIIIASVFLKEKITRSEWAAGIVVVGISVIRSMIGSAHG
jgi:drug/metabolite transporter (DMT)-like permease